MKKYNTMQKSYEYLNDITFLTGKKVLCLSPHHDDLLYSAALLVQQLLKQNCTLINVCLFTQSCWIAQGIGDVEYISEMRFLEEQAASVEFGFSTISLHLSDSSVRGLDEVEELNVPINESFLKKCEEHFEANLGMKIYDAIIMPLAVGGHIDHRYTRIIGEKQNHIPIHLYYEDMPYLTNPKQVYDYLPSKAKPIIVYGSLKEKRRGYECYPSQAEPNNWKRISTYCQQLIHFSCVERIWVCDNEE